jgi:hypothetical protein
MWVVKLKVLLIMATLLRLGIFIVRLLMVLLIVKVLMDGVKMSDNVLNYDTLKKLDKKLQKECEK